MSEINRAAFLDGGRKFKREPLDVEGIGSVFVREVSAGEARDQSRRNKEPDADDLTNTAWLVAQVVCDKTGERLLVDSDVDALKLMPIRVLKSVTDKATELSRTKKNETLTTPASGSPSTSAES